MTEAKKGTCTQKKPYVMEMEPGTYWWCSCGKSEKQPFCDGKHKSSEFTPIKVVIDEAKRVAWCGCRHSDKEKGAFCNGAHNRIEE